MGQKMKGKKERKSHHLCVWGGGGDLFQFLLLVDDASFENLMFMGRKLKLKCSCMLQIALRNIPQCQTLLWMWRRSPGWHHRRCHLRPLPREPQELVLSRPQRVINSTFVPYVPLYEKLDYCCMRRTEKMRREICTTMWENEFVVVY